MLEISPQAADLLHAARATEGLPESYGVRVYAQSDDDGGLFVRLAFVEGPGEGDHVSQQQPIPLFIAPGVHQAMGDAVLDVEAGVGPPHLVLLRAS